MPHAGGCHSVLEYPHTVEYAQGMMTAMVCAVPDD